MDLMIYKPFSKKEQPLNLSLSQKKRNHSPQTMSFTLINVNFRVKRHVWVILMLSSTMVLESCLVSCFELSIWLWDSSSAYLVWGSWVSWPPFDQPIERGELGIGFKDIEFEIREEETERCLSHDMKVRWSRETWRSWKPQSVKPAQQPWLRPGSEHWVESRCIKWDHWPDLRESLTLDSIMFLCIRWPFLPV